MASRMTSLIDPETGQARDGAIEVTDDLTVTLSLNAPDITLIAGFSDYPAAIVPQDFGGDRLRELDRTPVVFDFSKPSSRGYGETVSLLARMSRFVVADLTDVLERSRRL